MFKTSSSGGVLLLNVSLQTIFFLEINNHLYNFTAAGVFSPAEVVPAALLTKL